MFAIPHVTNARDATILMCVASAAFDFGQAATWASIVDIGGRHAGIATGLINFGNVGNAIQPYVGARIVEAYAWSTLFGIYSVAFLLAGAMWLIIDPRRRFHEEQ
jgi:ACS family glucarate transporter-like MFS transporter